MKSEVRGSSSQRENKSDFSLRFPSWLLQKRILAIPLLLLLTSCGVNQTQETILAVTPPAETEQISLEPTSRISDKNSSFAVVVNPEIPDDLRMEEIPLADSFEGISPIIIGDSQVMAYQHPELDIVYVQIYDGKKHTLFAIDWDPIRFGKSDGFFFFPYKRETNKSKGDNAIFSLTSDLLDSTLYFQSNPSSWEMGVDEH
jgi:hypothetical protein